MEMLILLKHRQFCKNAMDKANMLQPADVDQHSFGQYHESTCHSKGPLLSAQKLSFSAITKDLLPCAPVVVWEPKAVIQRHLSKLTRVLGVLGQSPILFWGMG